MRKIYSVVMCLLLALSLCACGGKTGANETANVSDAQTDSPSQSSEAAESKDTAQTQAPAPQESYLLVETDAADGSWVHIYTYNDQLQLVNETSYRAAEGVRGDVMDSRDYEYKTLENGNVQKTCQQNNLLEEYDPEGRLVMSGRLDSETKYYYEYDENNRLIKKSCETRTGYAGNTQYDYDENGNLIKEESFDTDNRSTGYYEYTYDAEGRLIHKVIHYMDDGKETDSDDYGVLIWEDTRDVYGRVIAEENKYEGNGGTDESYEYVYDEHGGVCTKTDKIQKIIYHYLPQSEVLAAMK